MAQVDPQAHLVGCSCQLKYLSPVMAADVVRRANRMVEEEGRLDSERLFNLYRSRVRVSESGFFMTLARASRRGQIRKSSSGAN